MPEFCKTHQHDAKAGARSSVASPEAELLSGLLACKSGRPFPAPCIQKNTVSAILALFNLASPHHSAPLQGRPGKSTAHSTLRERNLDSVESLKRVFPE